MAAKAQVMLKKSLDALVNRDVALAYRVCAADEEVDNVNRQAYAVLMEAVQKNPPRLKTLIHQFTAMRQLERIADHATNIAEDVIYMLQGEIVRHRAEKYSAQPPRSTLRRNSHGERDEDRERLMELLRLLPHSCSRARPP